MNTFNMHAEPQRGGIELDDDEDDFGDVESRPLLGWFLMAVALVAMAFLIGSGPEASAGQVSAPTPAEPSLTALVLMSSEAAGLAFGG